MHKTKRAHGEHLTDITIAVYQTGKIKSKNAHLKKAAKLMLYSDVVELSNDQIKAVIKMIKVITRAKFK